jgi:hypothetical protein
VPSSPGGLSGDGRSVNSSLEEQVGKAASLIQFCGAVLSVSYET